MSENVISAGGFKINSKSQRRSNNQEDESRANTRRDTNELNSLSEDSPPENADVKYRCK